MAFHARTNDNYWRGARLSCAAVELNSFAKALSHHGHIFAQENDKNRIYSMIKLF